MATAQPLHIYRAKRDFSRTKEPAGMRRATPKISAKADGLYVIQKHDATRLHYDLRLEHDGVLWSWAVTRGPSLDPSEKRLAVHVEDHPVEYASFEGTIPKGEYGGGSVIVWDEGTWTPEFDPAAMMKKGHIDFEIHGEKLKGRWHLVRLRPHPGEKRDNWLLIKSDDAEARPSGDILKDKPKSVKSGLTVEQVGAGKAAKGDTPKIWHSNKPAGKIAKAVAAKRMAFIEPALATLQRETPSGQEWLHEVKFDGYRMQAHLAGTEVRLLTRTGLDWTEKFEGPVTAELGEVKCTDAILDGEVVVLGGNGASSFALLQADLSAGRTDRMIYYAFDLLRLDGEDLRDEPLVERKQTLLNLLGDGAGEGAVRYSEHFTEPGKVMLQHACRMGLEGVVSKQAGSPYRSGRGLAWIKSKCTLRQEFVITGYLPSEKTGRGLRSLLVGFHEKGKLHYAGRVGTGFSNRVGDDLRKKLDVLKTNKSPFDTKVPGGKGLVWVKPDLVAEIEFRSWTSDRIIRHASFQGLREDKPADEVVEEKPVSSKAAEKAAAKSATKGKADAKATADLGESKPKSRSVGKAAPKVETSIKLNNPNKLLWPDDGVTKQGLLDHYKQVWPHMRRFVVDRPLSLVRAPDGVGGQRFFQKHASPGMSEAIARTTDPEDGKEILYVRDFDGLAALVQMGVVEIHIWGCTVDALSTPDQIVFDLDPDEAVDADAVRAAALDIHARLEELSLPSMVKTSGGKGYHVVVPLRPAAGWETVKGFAHDFARALAQAQPERFTATLSKRARHGRIFIDYLRNGRGSTTVTPWSTRGRAGATVSVPIIWQDIKDGVAPDAYRVASGELTDKLAVPDPWADFFKLGKELKRR